MANYSAIGMFVDVCLSNVHDKSKVINLKFWLCALLCMCIHSIQIIKHYNNVCVFISVYKSLELDRVRVNHWINSNGDVNKRTALFPSQYDSMCTFQDESLAPSIPYLYLLLSCYLLPPPPSLLSLFHNQHAQLFTIKSHFKQIS